VVQVAVQVSSPFLQAIRNLLHTLDFAICVFLPMANVLRLSSFGVDRLLLNKRLYFKTELLSF